MQEFFELSMGSMTMEEYEKNFLGLLKYVGFINDEKVKIQRFFSGLPSFYKENIRMEDLERIRRRIILIRGGKDSNLPSLGMILIEIIKISMLRVNPRKRTLWEKEEGHLSNVGYANKITCTRIVHTERTE
jgi:hypothetical protein